MLYYTYLYVLLSLFTYSESTCTYPADLTTGSWHDNQLGLITFNSTHFVTTSAVGEFGTQTFECYETFGNIFYSVTPAFQFFSSTFRLGLCWALTQHSSTKFIYYSLVPILQNTTNLRVLFKLNSSSFSLSSDCSTYSTPYDAYLIRALIQNGTISSGRSQCPDVLLGTYLYSYDTGSGDLCSSGSELDVCNDTSLSLMTFNYTTCSEIQGYSREGNLNCVYSDSLGPTWYTLVYNLDSTEPDDLTYFRYTCYAAYQESNGTVYVTQYPKTCQDNQSAFSISSPGASLILYPNVTCVPVITTTAAAASTEELFNAGTFIAVAALVVTVITASSIVGCCWCYKKWKAKKVGPLKKGKIPFDKFDRAGSAASRSNVNVTPYSPYPTLSEIATFRFGPSPIPDDDGGLTLGTHTPGLIDGEAITLAPTTPGPYGYYYYDEEDDDEDEDEDEEDENEVEKEENSGVIKEEDNQEIDMEGNDNDAKGHVIVAQQVKKGDGDDISLPMYTDYGSDTSEPTRLNEVVEDDKIDAANENENLDHAKPRSGETVLPIADESENVEIDEAKENEDLNRVKDAKPPSRETILSITDESVSRFDDGFSVRP